MVGAIATVWGGLPARCFGWVGWPPGVREPAFGGRGRGWHGSAADSAPQPWVSGKQSLSRAYNGRITAGVMGWGASSR